MEERDLIARARTGDRVAMGELYELHARRVFTVVRRLVGDDHLAEDLSQEAWIRAFDKLHLFRGDAAFGTWLYRLAANHVVDHGRRARKERGRTEMPEQLVDPAAGQGEQALGRERARVLREALEEVPDHYRETLFLVYIEGMKIEEASRTSGLPPGTIKTRLMRGREALRRILTRRYPELFGV